MCHAIFGHSLGVFDVASSLPNSLTTLAGSLLIYHVRETSCNSSGCLDGGPEDEYHEMHLLPEPLFTLQTDNVYMSGITGTISGRVFLCGRDGCVYEMDYQVSAPGLEIEENTAWHSISSKCPLAIFIPDLSKF